MKHVWLFLATFLGLAAAAVPASADVTYVLNCSSIACSPSGNYGTVTLHQLGSGSTASVELTVNLISAMQNFAGTGAGFAINWNVTGNPNLTTAIHALDYNNDPLPAGAIYNTSHFAIQDNTTSGNTYKASPFGNTWQYAIEYTQNGGNSSNDNYLIFDVTKAGGLLLSNFAATADGFYFAVDIFSQVNGSPCNPTCVVASNKKVPEPGTMLMIIAGLGALVMFQRRRKLVRAA